MEPGGSVVTVRSKRNDEWRSISKSHLIGKGDFPMQGILLLQSAGGLVGRAVPVVSYPSKRFASRQTSVSPKLTVAARPT